MDNMIFPHTVLWSNDNDLSDDDINSFLNFVIEKLINFGINIIKEPTCSVALRNDQVNDNYFIRQILIEKGATFYSLKFVFNKKGSFSFGLFSLYNPYPEKPVPQYSLRRILLEGEITLKIFFETFFKQIINQLT